MLLSLFYDKLFRSYVSKKSRHPLVYLSSFYGINKKVKSKADTYSSLDELEGPLVLADLEQLAHSLLIRLQTRHLTDEIAHKLAVLVLVSQATWSRRYVLGQLVALVGAHGDLHAGWQLADWLDHFVYA